MSNTDNSIIKILRDGEVVDSPLTTRQREQIAALAPHLLDEIVNDMFVEDLRAAAKTLRGGLNVGAAAMARGNAKEETQRAWRLDYMADKIDNEGSISDRQKARVSLHEPIAQTVAEHNRRTPSDLGWG